MTKGRSIVALLALAFITTAFAGCLGGDGGGGGEEPTPTTPTQTTPTNGGDGPTQYVVGTEAAFPPFEDIQDGEFVGFDIDVMREIAERNGWEVEFRNLGFDVLIPSVQQGQVDMAISAMSITDERSEQVDFSIAYYEANQSITQRADDSETYESLDDLRGKSITFGVQTGTVAADIVDEEFVNQDDGQLRRYDSYPLAIAALKNGDVDVVMMDAPAQREAVNQDQGIKFAFEFSTGDTYGIAIQKGRTDLLNQVNAALVAMSDDGTLAELKNKWGI